MNVAFLPGAKHELLAISAYYQARVVGLGDRFLDEVERALLLLQQHPMAWPVKLEPDVRQIGLRRFPYALIYRAKDEQAIIIAVAHLRRRPAYWRRRMQLT